MTIKKRGNTYWIDVQINGQRVRESLKTSDPEQAKMMHDIRRAELWRGLVLKERKRYTVGQAFDRWMIEKAAKRDAAGDQAKINVLRPALGKLMLDSVTAADVEQALPHGVAPATCNRYRALVRSVCRRAMVNWQWIDRLPLIELEDEDNDDRGQFITREQAMRLIEELPERYRAQVRFALNTGLRRSNVFDLEWRQVNLEARTLIVFAKTAKGKKQFVIPLNTAARAILEDMPHRQGRVFGDIWRVPPATWTRACKRAGLPDGFRFHDLRHTWASWQVQAGTPLQVLQQLGAWATFTMVLRYARFAPTHTAEAAERVTL